MESGRSFDQNDTHFGRMTSLNVCFIGAVGGGRVVNGEGEGCAKKREYLKMTSFHIQRKSECQGNVNFVTPLQVGETEG